MCNVCEDLLSNIQGLYVTSLNERNSPTNFEAPAWRFRWSRSPPWCDDWMSLALQGGPRCHPKSPPRFASMCSLNTAAPSKTTRGQNRDLRLRENATRSGTTGWDRRWDCQSCAKHSQVTLWWRLFGGLQSLNCTCKLDATKRWDRDCWADFWETVWRMPNNF